MIPFLKTKQEAGVSMPDEVKMRTPDEADGYEMLDAVCEDMMEAFHKKDKSLLKMALESLISHIKEEDEVQDQSLES